MTLDLTALSFFLWMGAFWKRGKFFPPAVLPHGAACCRSLPELAGGLRCLAIRELDCMIFRLPSVVCFLFCATSCLVAIHRSLLLSATVTISGYILSSESLTPRHPPTLPPRLETLSTGAIALPMKGLINTSIPLTRTTQGRTESRPLDGIIGPHPASRYYRPYRGLEVFSGYQCRGPTACGFDSIL